MLTRFQSGCPSVRHCFRWTGRGIIFYPGFTKIFTLTIIFQRAAAEICPIFDLLSPHWSTSNSTETFRWNSEKIQCNQSGKSIKIWMQVGYKIKHYRIIYNPSNSNIQHSSYHINLPLKKLFVEYSVLDDQCDILDCWSPWPDGWPGRRGGEHLAPGRGPGAGPGQVISGAGRILLSLQTPHTNVCQGEDIFS